MEYRDLKTGRFVKDKGRFVKDMKQKTFYGISFSEVDSLANKFRMLDGIRAIASQTHLGFNPNGTILFTTTVFYTESK